MSFAGKMGKTICKNISKNLSSKYSQKLLDHGKQSATDALKTATKRAIQKTSEATGDLIPKKIAENCLKKFTKKIIQKTNEEEIPGERFIPSEIRQKIINDLRLKEENYWLYQKIINLLDDTANQPSRFRTRNWVETNDESWGDYDDDNNNNEDDNNKINFRKTMIRSSLCDYRDAYILVKGTITVTNTEAASVAVNNTDKKVVLKYCAPFTSCITEINNAQSDYAEDTDLVMPVYNLIEHSNADSKTSGSLWQYYRDEPAIDANGNIVDFPANDNYSN